MVSTVYLVFEVITLGTCGSHVSQNRSVQVQCFGCYAAMLIFVAVIAASCSTTHV